MDLVRFFVNTLIEWEGERSKSNEGRRQITCNPFRIFVKSTIFDLGYFDYSERFMGYMV